MKRWLAAAREWVLGCFSRKRLTPKMRSGRAGEDFAAKHLRGLGWKIVTRNWRRGRDEIDIVARDGPNLVFVEVKTRATAESQSGGGYSAVNRRKKQALFRACRAYMENMERTPAHFRFDIIEVEMLADGVPGELRHHQGVPLFPRHFFPRGGRGG
jgi:putative endonuclease